MPGTSQQTMTTHGLWFHHLGLATRHPEVAKTMLAGLGYRIGEPVFDPEQNLNLILCEGGAGSTLPPVEIAFPAAADGPVGGLLAKQPAGLVYHLCFATTDLDETLQKMEASGLHAFCVLPPKPALLFQLRRVSFYMVNGFGLIEILEDGVACE